MRNKTLTHVAGYLMGAAALTLASAASSQTAPLPAEHVRDTQVRQEQIRAQTRDAADRLDEIIAQFERNGLGGGEDVKVLKAVRAVLNNLSAEQMHQVVTLLQQARGAADAERGWADVTEAYRGQKGIIGQLHQLLREYQYQQRLFELSIRMGRLAERQNANLQAAVRLAKLNKPANQLTPDQRASLDAQQAEQAALRDEINATLQELQKVADTSGAADDPTRQALAEAQRRRLAEHAASAAADLKEGNLFKAASSEKQARDTLRELARTITPLDQAARLRQAAQELDRAIADQQALNQQVEKTQEANRLKELEEAQADLVDRADKTARDIQKDAPSAAKILQQAQNPMQDARAALNAAQKQQAAQQTQSALEQLQAARQDVQRSLEAAEARQANPQDRLETARQAQQEIKELIARQEQLATATHADRHNPSKLNQSAPPQRDLAASARGLRTRALAVDPEVSRNVEQAAANMDAATQRLSGDNPTNPATQQQAALAALRKAEQALNQQLAALEQKQQELQQVEKAQDQLAQAARRQQDVNLDTAKQAAQPDADHATQTAQQQQKVHEQAAQIQQQLPPTARQAAAALDRAKDAMQQSEQQLQANHPQAAQPPQQQATDELQKAGEALADRARQLREELGQSPNDPQQDQQNQQIAQALQKAQQELDQAAANLPPDQSPAIQQLQKEQQALANQVQQMQQAQPESSPENQQHLADAHNAAEQAAEQLKQNNPADAAKSMQQAADAMKQAAPPADAQQAPLQQAIARQQQLQKQAEALAQAQQGTPQHMEQAATHLENAANQVADATQQGQNLPAAAQQAMQQAQQALNQATAQAAAQQGQPAAQHAQHAQEAIAQAQAALALAQQGMQPGQPTPSPSAQSGRQADEANATAGDGNRQDLRGVPTDAAATGDATGSSAYIGLPERDRQAIQQSKADKYPQEYAPMVEQYLRNLSDQPSR